MKLLILLLSIALTQKSCNESNINQDELSMEYVLSSRGLFKQINIDNKTVYTINKRDGNAIEKICTDTDWNKLLIHLKNIDIEHISKLEAPSKNFQFDGTAMARLTITSQGKTYESQSFDHGNPPEEISILVKEILSIGENIE